MKENLWKQYLKNQHEQKFEMTKRLVLSNSLSQQLQFLPFTFFAGKIFSTYYRSEWTFENLWKPFLQIHSQNSIFTKILQVLYVHLACHGLLIFWCSFHFLRIILQTFQMSYPSLIFWPIMANQFLIAQIRPKYKLSPKMHATMDRDIEEEKNVYQSILP